jgi:hypothetical protein
MTTNLPPNAHAVADLLPDARTTDAILPQDSQVPAELQHGSLAPRFARVMITFGVFAVLSCVLMRWQRASTGQAAQLPAILLLAFFAVGTLLVGSDSVYLLQAFLKQRKSKLSPWATVIWSLVIVMVVMIALAGVLLLARLM